MVNQSLSLGDGLIDYFEYCKKALGDDFQYRKEGDTAVFFKKGYDFLGDNLSLYEAPYFRQEGALLPGASLRKYDAHRRTRNDHKGFEERDKMFFVDRELNFDGIILDDTLPILANLYRKRLKHSKFEEVIGLKIYEESDVADLYHKFSGGIELFGLTSKAPEDLRVIIERDLAKAFRELHDRKIEYKDPLPTNMRYDFERVIFNPHNCILFNRKKLHESRDLGILLYTNPWIDLNRFVRAYCGNSADEKELKYAKAGIESTMECMDDDMEEVSSIWERKVISKREYAYSQKINRRSYFE